MNKRLRQYAGILSCVVFYYIIHEGAHLACALLTGSFKEIKFMGLGMQIDIYADQMTNTGLFLFCLAGAVSTLVFSYILTALAGKICRSRSKVFKACSYYVTIGMLFIDPLYLSVLCGFFGGGDMNGISLILPETVARIAFGVILVVNVIVFFKMLLPKYKESFVKENI